jgi:hypothetical protein
VKDKWSNGNQICQDCASAQRKAEDLAGIARSDRHTRRKCETDNAKVGLKASL